MNRPDPMIPCKPGAEDTICMENRQKWLEALYKHDGRFDKAHPQHGHYTGLAAKYNGVDCINGEA